MLGDKIGPCGECGRRRRLVWSWDICLPCYSRSEFDPSPAEFLHPESLERETDPAVLAEHQADDADAARHGEYA